MQSIDRELFSELIESPINPPFHYMCTPSMNECNPMLYLQLTAGFAIRRNFKPKARSGI